MSFIKQVIVIRKDLGMRAGKMIAQGAHASMKVIIDRLQATDRTVEEHRLFHLWLDPVSEEWVTNRFAKIVCRVESEAALLELYKQAGDAKLPCALITDVGKTEFHGVPTHTAIAIGPDYADKIDPITGELKLL